MDIVISKNKIPIRLTNERWVHITEEHSEMAGYYFEILETIENPEVIYKGREGEFIAAMANRILYHPANLIMYHIERRSSFLSLFI